MKKFNEYTKNEKIFRICNYCFSVVMLILVIIAFIRAIIDFGFNASLRWMSPVVHVSLIYILQLVLRVRVSNFVLLFYNVYIFFAAVLGTSFDFYNIKHYDDIMHSLFGYVGCIGGLYMLVKLGDYKNMSTPLIMLTTMFVSMGCASIWELCEYFCDNVFGATSQGNAINGIVPLQDTMQDILDNFCGMLVFEIHFLIHYLTKKKLLIGNMVDDFTNN